MTDNKIIYKAVLKAQKNGYANSDVKYFLNANLWEMLIFDIDFAKAFFGEVQELTHFVGTPGGLEDCEYEIAWKYHLQKMVILEENKRIKYLEKFL